MTTIEISQQAKAFLYELNDARHEYSFSSLDTWTYSQCTAKEKLLLENKFYPVFFRKCDVNDISAFYKVVAASKSELEPAFEGSSKDKIYVVAHCPTKLK